jgi:hypothetical protein
MRTILKSILPFFFLILTSNFFLHAQHSDSLLLIQPKIFVVEKNDGTKFVGEILKDDPREVLIKTERLGEVYIPKHEIKEIKEYQGKVEVSKSGVFIEEELFATRYFITTNGLSIKKGENYMIWNLYGPDFQFGLADNIGVGVMTSWFAVPIIGTIKWSKQFNDKTSMAIGALAGTGSWALPEFGLLLPYTSFTFGNRKTNLTFSTGYGLVFYQENIYNQITYEDDQENYSEGRFLLSVAGMAKIGPKLSLVFDSFIMPRGAYRDYTEWQYGYWDEAKNVYIESKQIKVRKRTPNLTLFLPGLRWQMDKDRAFQFGFSGLHYDGEFIQMPIPMVQWYRKL